MRRIVLDLQGGLLAEAVMQVLAGYDPTSSSIALQNRRIRLRFAEAVMPMCW